MDIKNLSKKEWFLILIDADSHPKLTMSSLIWSLAHLCFFSWMGFSFFWCILGPILFFSNELLGCLYFPTRRLIWNEIKNAEKFSLGVKGEPSEPKEELTIIKSNLFSVRLEDVNGKRFFNSKPRTSKILSKAVFLLLKTRVFIGFVGSSYATFLVFRKFNLI